MPRENWTVGEYTITSIVEEQSERIPPGLFYAGHDVQDILRHGWLTPDFADERGRLKFRVQAFVIQGNGRTLLVDPCVGSQKRRQNPYWNMKDFPFLERMAEAGLSLGSVDTVVHTHLHPDHLGWDTRRVGDTFEPTFPKARYLYTARELEAVRGETNAAQDVYGDSVAPIFAAGLAEVVDENAELAPGLRLESTAGHTPGHVCLWIASRGEHALITGDIVHNPVQCSELSWPHLFDADPEAARETRARMLRAAHERGALVLGTHFSNRPAGKLLAEGSAFRFVPVP